MQSNLTSFFKIKPKSEMTEGSLVDQMKQQQMNEYKKSQLKKKEEDKITINQFQQQMQIEESQQTSYQRKLLLRERNERRQRDLGIGCRITNDIYLGSIDSGNNLAWLELENISVVINCTSECYNEEYEGVKYLRFPISKQMKSFKQFVNEFVAQVNEAKLKGEKVLIHSELGKNRSAALLIAYFIITQKLNFIKANTLVEEKSWKLDLSLPFISELNEISKQQNVGFISTNVHPMNCQPFVRQVLHQADLQLLDKKRRYDFQMNQFQQYPNGNQN